MRGDAGTLSVRAVRPQNVALAAAFAAFALVSAAVPAGGSSVVRIALAGSLIGLAFVQWIIDWRGLVVMLAAWLVLLGLVRRLLTAATERVDADPLLLVGPVVLGLMVLSAFRNGALTRRSGLTAAVIALGCITVLASLNVSRAPLLAGAAALLFVLVPQLGFWPGRVLPDTVLHAVLRVFAGLAILVAGYGLMQTFAGLPPWDLRWVSESGYQALNVGELIRAFGTSASAAEFSSVLTIGIVCWLVLPMASRWVTFAAVAVLVTALVLVSSRGPVVLLVVALVMIAAARFSLPGGVAVVLVIAATVLLPVLASLLVPHAAVDSTTAPLLQHQVEGLANPFDPESSTLLGHLVLAGKGLASALQYPFGQGIGVVTLGTKFGGSEVQTEADLSNTAVAFGPIGVVIFLVVFGLGLVRAYRTASRTRAPLALAALGILLATTNHWLNGGMYAVAWLPWLVLGWLDRPTAPAARGEETDGVTG